MIIEKDPVCDTCHATCIGGYSWTEHSNGVIAKIACHDCHDRERLDDWRETKRLTAGLVMTATIVSGMAHTRRDWLEKMASSASKSSADAARETLIELNAIVASADDVKLTLDNFAFKCWDRVSRMIDDEKCARGMSAEYSGLKIRSFVSAGRVLFHVERGDAFCSAIAEEGNSKRGLGLQGIFATEEQASTLWLDAIEAFANGTILVADKNVGIG